MSAEGAKGRDGRSDALSSLERRVVQAVDEGALVEGARRMIRIPSWGGEETPAQEAMADLMAAAGLEVDLWDIDLDALARHPHYCAEIHRERALGLVGTLGGAGGGRTLVLNGHVDVVPSGDEALWKDPPFDAAIRDGRLHGRGALDMKGALLAGLQALAAIRASGVQLAGTVHLQSVVGEEDGGSGTLATVLRGYRGDGAIVLEPTEMAVAPALAGVLNFRVRIPGLAAHGAVRDEGVSALEKLFPVYAALQRLERERNERMGGDEVFAEYALPFPIAVGTIRGGDWASSVPDHVTVEGRMGLAPEEDPAEARKAMERALAAVAASDEWLRDHPPELNWWGGRYLGTRTSGDHPVVVATRSAAAATLGRPPVLRGMTYGADLGLLARVGGTPGVLFGPGDIRRAHRPDEWVAVEELVATARAVAVAAVRFCGVVGEGGPGAASP